MSEKYSQLEIERRWKVIESDLPDFSILHKRIITDKYLDNSRLRLRKISDSSGTQFKLCKKYGKHSEISESITNIVLSEQEYLSLSNVSGRYLVRERYYYPYKGNKFSINVIISGVGPIIVEAEFASEYEALTCEPPVFCGEEVSSDPLHEAVQFTHA